METHQCSVKFGYAGSLTRLLYLTLGMREGAASAFLRDHIGVLHNNQNCKGNVFELLMKVSLCAVTEKPEESRIPADAPCFKKILKASLFEMMPDI